MAISLFIKTDADVNPKYILIISHTSLTFSDEKSVGALKKCKTFVGQKIPAKMLRLKHAQGCALRKIEGCPVI